MLTEKIDLGIQDSMKEGDECGKALISWDNDRRYGSAEVKLSPLSKKVARLPPSLGSFLGVCIFSLCMIWFSPSSHVSSHRSKRLFGNCSNYVGL